MNKETVIIKLKNLIKYLETNDIDHMYLIRFNHYTEKLLQLEKNIEHGKKLKNV